MSPAEEFSDPTEIEQPVEKSLADDDEGDTEDYVPSNPVEDTHIEVRPSEGEPPSLDDSAFDPERTHLEIRKTVEGQ